MSLAAIAYLVVRVLLFRNRRLQRDMQARQALREGLRRHV